MKPLREENLTIYTDGSMYSKPRVGGIGIRFIYYLEKGTKEIIKDLDYQGFKGATNNQMELLACVYALREAQNLDHINRLSQIDIFTDSRYVSDNYSKAMFEWPKSKWLTRTGTPVLNTQEWKDLVKQIKKVNKKVNIEWVKGHAKDPHNKAVDGLAKKSAKSATHDPLHYVDLRRKKSPKKTRLQSVEMLGQRIIIRIITCEYLNYHKVFKLRYEVMSKGSKYYQNVDFIISKDALRTGRTYQVVFNKDIKNPQIVRTIKEIESK